MAITIEDVRDKPKTNKKAKQEGGPFKSNPDPQKRLRNSVGVMYLIAVVNILLGLGMGFFFGKYTVWLWESALSIAFGTAFVVLSIWVKRRSKIALGIGMGIIIVDMAYSLVVLAMAGGSVIMFVLILRIIILWVMYGGFSAIRELKKKEKGKPKKIEYGFGLSVGEKILIFFVIAAYIFWLMLALGFFDSTEVSIPCEGYENEHFDFCIVGPSEWIMTTNHTPDVPVIKVEFYEPSVNMNYSTHLQVSAGYAKPGEKWYTDEDTLMGIFDGMQITLPDGTLLNITEKKLLGIKDKIVAGYPAKEFTIELGMTVDSSLEEEVFVIVKTSMTYVNIDGVLYSFAYFSGKDIYDLYYDEVMESISTFRLM